MTTSNNLATINSARGSSVIGVSLATFALLEALVMLQAWLAYKDHFLTLAQMQGRGVRLGLPFAWHFGMWGDVFIVSPLAAYVTGRFVSRWRFRQILASFSAGLAAAVVMHYSYTFSDIQDAHIQYHVLTRVGFVHLVYMAITLAIFTQFFF